MLALQIQGYYFCETLEYLQPYLIPMYFILLDCLHTLNSETDPSSAVVCYLASSFFYCNLRVAVATQTAHAADSLSWEPRNRGTGMFVPSVHNLLLLLGSFPNGMVLGKHKIVSQVHNG
jgi:hypothetical protein